MRLVGGTEIALNIGLYGNQFVIGGNKDMKRALSTPLIFLIAPIVLMDFFLLYIVSTIL